MIYMHSIHIRNADIVLICVYMYYMYTVFLLLFIADCFTVVLFYIVKLNIIFVYCPFYLLCTNKYYYYEIVTSILWYYNINCY